MTEQEKKNSGLFLMNKSDKYLKEHHYVDPEIKMIVRDCMLAGWHSALEWLEENGCDVHGAFRDSE